MRPVPDPTRRQAFGAWRRAGLASAWVAGVALQLNQPALWDGAAYPLLLAAGLGGWLVVGRLRPAGARDAARLLATLAVGFAFAGWRADVRVADALAPAWEGCDIELTGTVDGLPEVAEDGLHFAFAVDSARPWPMTARALARVAALDEAADRPLPQAVRVAELSARPSPGNGPDDDEDEADDA